MVFRRWHWLRTPTHHSHPPCLQTHTRTLLRWPPILGNGWTVTKELPRWYIASYHVQTHTHTHTHCRLQIAFHCTLRFMKVASIKYGQGRHFPLFFVDDVSHFAGFQNEVLNWGKINWNFATWDWFKKHLFKAFLIDFNPVACSLHGRNCGQSILLNLTKKWFVVWLYGGGGEWRGREAKASSLSKLGHAGTQGGKKVSGVFTGRKMDLHFGRVWLDPLNKECNPFWLTRVCTLFEINLVCQVDTGAGLKSEWAKTGFDIKIACLRLPCP